VGGLKLQEVFVQRFENGILKQPGLGAEVVEINHSATPALRAIAAVVVPAVPVALEFIACRFHDPIDNLLRCTAAALRWRSWRTCA